MNFLRVFILAGFMAFVFTPDASAAWGKEKAENQICTGENCFPKTADIFGQVYPARGAGTKNFLLSKLYDAVLYMDPKVPAREALGPVAKKLVIRYRRKITRQQLIDSANHHVEKSAFFKDVQARADELHRFYVDVDKGDEYSLVYAPGQGTELFYNGTSQIKIPGDDFASAYFSVWLSDHVWCKRIRKKLLAL